MGFYQEYELLGLIHDGPTKTLRAREIASDQPVFLHLLTGALPPDTQRTLLERVDALRARSEDVRKIGEFAGTRYVVTGVLEPFSNLEQWVAERIVGADGPDGAADPSLSGSGLSGPSLSGSSTASELARRQGDGGRTPISGDAPATGGLQPPRVSPGVSADSGRFPTSAPVSGPHVSGSPRSEPPSQAYASAESPRPSAEASNTGPGNASAPPRAGDLQPKAETDPGSAQPSHDKQHTDSKPPTAVADRARHENSQSRKPASTNGFDGSPAGPPNQVSPDRALRALTDSLEPQTFPLLRDAEADSYLDEAEQGLQDDTVRGALDSLESALKLGPNDHGGLTDAGGEKQVEWSAHAKEELQVQKEWHYQKAREAWEDGDLEATLDELGRLSNLESGHPGESGRSGIYREFLKQVQDENEAVKTAYREARALLAEENLAAALSICDRFLAKFPNHAQFQALRFDIGERRRQEALAFIADTDRRIDAEPDLDRRIEILTQALERSPGEKHFEEAMRLVREKQQLVRSVADKAKGLEQSRRLREALEQWQLLESIHARQPGLRDNIQRVENAIQKTRVQGEARSRWVSQSKRCLQAGEYEQALELVRNALVECPDDPELRQLELEAGEGLQRAHTVREHLHQAQQHWHAGRRAEGLAELREAQKVDPRNTLVRGELVNALAELARQQAELDWAAAQPLVEEILQIEPNHSTAVRLLEQIGRQKREEMVSWCLVEARRLQAAGELEAAYDLVSENLSQYPDEDRLSQVRATLAHQIDPSQALEADPFAVVPQDDGWTPQPEVTDWPTGVETNPYPENFAASDEGIAYDAKAEAPDESDWGYAADGDANSEPAASTEQDTAAGDDSGAEHDALADYDAPADIQTVGGYAKSYPGVVSPTRSGAAFEAGNAGDREVDEAGEADDLLEPAAPPFDEAAAELERLAARSTRSRPILLEEPEDLLSRLASDSAGQNSAVARAKAAVPEKPLATASPKEKFLAKVEAVRRRLAGKNFEAIGRTWPVMPTLLGVAAAFLLLAIIAIVVISRMADGGTAPTTAGLAVTIESAPPGATLIVDGEACAAPCQLELSAAAHRVEAQLAGFRPAVVSFDVNEANAGQPFVVTLSPYAPTLQISSDLASGKLTLDGEAIGELDDGGFELELTGLSEGEHKLQLAGEGNSAAISFEIPAGGAPRLTAPPSVSDLKGVVVAGLGPDALIHGTEAGQAVAVDGEPMGKLGATPLVLQDLSEGPHELTLGDGRDQRRVVFDSGQSPLLAAFLNSDREVGSLRVITAEDDVQIFLNGTPYRRKTARGRRLIYLYPNKIEVRVEKEGFRNPPPQVAEIKKGEEVQLAFEMTPLPRTATLRITNAIPGTEVWVDGQSRGIVRSGIFTLANLEPGRHAIRLEHDEYKTAEFAQEVGPNAVLELDGAMESDVGTLEIEVSPADVDVRLSLQREGESSARAVTDRTLRLTAGTYTVQASANGFQDFSATVRVAVGQTKTASLTLRREEPKPVQPAVSLADWEKNGWRREGELLIRRGGDYVIAPNSGGAGRYTFTALLQKGKRLEWVVNYTDRDNYVFYQLGDDYLHRTEVSKGKKSRTVKIPHKMKWGGFLSVDINVKPDSIAHRVLVGDDWVELDNWQNTGADLTAGKFGFHIPGRDQVGLSHFAFLPQR